MTKIISSDAVKINAQKSEAKALGLKVRLRYYTPKTKAAYFVLIIS